MANEVGNAITQLDSQYRALMAKQVEFAATAPGRPQRFALKYNFMKRLIARIIDVCEPLV